MDPADWMLKLRSSPNQRSEGVLGRWDQQQMAGCSNNVIPSASSVFLTATTRGLSSVSLRVCFLEGD